MSNKKELATLGKHIKEKTLLYGEISKLGRDENGDTIMTLQTPAGLPATFKYMIPASEIEVEVSRPSYIPSAEGGPVSAERKKMSYVFLMGKKIPLVILSVDGDVVTCSRSEGLQQVRENFIKESAEGKVLKGTITNFSHPGAFVEVSGISGLLTAGDFSTDYSAVSEYFKQGDTIEVKCKSVSPKNGRISWEVPQKFSRTQPIKHNLEASTIVCGKVVGIQAFEAGVGVFVNIEAGIDALCQQPEDIEIEQGSKVAVLITSISPGKTETSTPRVRGKIVRAL